MEYLTVQEKLNFIHAILNQSQTDMHDNEGHMQPMKALNATVSPLVLGFWFSKFAPFSLGWPLYFSIPVQ